MSCPTLRSIPAPYSRAPVSPIPPTSRWCVTKTGETLGCLGELALRRCLKEPTPLLFASARSSRTVRQREILPSADKLTAPKPFPSAKFSALCNALPSYFRAIGHLRVSSHSPLVTSHFFSL